MTINIPPEYDAKLRAAASAAGYDNVEQFVIDKLLGGASTPPPGASRQGGQWKGKVWMADEFDELPDDLREAFGMICREH